MEKQELFILIDKFLSGKANAVEEQMLFNYYESYQQADVWDEQVLGSQDHALKEVFDRLQVAMSEEKRAVAIYKEVKTPVAPAYRVHFLRRSFFRYAAAIFIIFGIGAYLWTTNKKNDQQTLASDNKRLQVDIAPGTNKAVLTVDNKQINLASDKTGITVGKTIAYTDGQKLSDAGKMLMLTTPKGGQYQLVLSDGSKVWLNAASSIKFPAAFKDAKRIVDITGEVYMEIVQNPKQPFVVNAYGTEVQVLGTSFNVNAYEDEEAIKTTLVTGSIKVLNINTAASDALVESSPTNKSSQQSKSSVILKPGQQATIAVTVSSDRQPKVIDADLDKTLAWKNGIFNFDGLDMKSVMRQLERWYDIKVQYQNNVGNIKFKGAMYRNVSLSDVLEMLEGMKVKLKLEGKTLIVF